MKTPIKNKYLVPSILALAATFAGTQSAYGQSLAFYNFDGGSAASIDTEPNSTASAFDVSNISGTISSGTGTAYTLASLTPTAIDKNSDYFSFTVTPTSGFEMDFTQLTFGTLFNGAPDDVEGLATNFVVRSDLDDFDSNISLIFTEDYIKTTGLPFTARSVNLSGAGFQNISSPVEFRIYIYDSSVASDRLPRVDNIVLTGSVNAIPEVKSFAVYVGLLAIFTVFGTRRFKR